MEENFEEVTVFGKPALFTPSRIARGTIPTGYYLYELRHDDDCKGDVVQIGWCVLVNHWGSLITADEIELPADGFMDVEPDIINYGAGDCHTMNEFISKYQPQ